MTSLEIIKALKSARSDALLWINEDRKEAAFHGATADVSYAVTVDFNAALVAKSDPALGIVDTTDGTIYAAI
tara:strand:+ start:525 stop:740 length:216 start_codon:yes stop_codon:yes gene_type:complete